MQLRVSFGAVRSWSFCALKQGLINLGKFQKDLILFVRSCCFSGLIQGLENLETPCKGIRVVTFRHVGDIDPKADHLVRRCHIPVVVARPPGVVHIELHIEPLVKLGAFVLPVDVIVLGHVFRFGRMLHLLRHKGRAGGKRQCKA